MRKRFTDLRRTIRTTVIDNKKLCIFECLDPEALKAFFKVRCDVVDRNADRDARSWRFNALYRGDVIYY